MNSLQTIIEQAWENRALLQERNNRLVELLDAGKLQVAEPKGDAWQVNEWVKTVVMKMETWAGIFEYHDKMELKKLCC
jgi:2,3,4,5-tetrahydropyridine-2-carboxylate N-succinyltransferase